MLPDELPLIEGWTNAVRYLPAGRTDAGGDFYDVMPLEDGPKGYRMFKEKEDGCVRAVFRPGV